MLFQLKYGDGATLRLDVPADAVLADGCLPHGEPLDDPAAAVAAALAHPFDFPPLRQAVVPGDHIVLAVDHSLPEVQAVVAGAVGVLLESGISAQDVMLVLSPGGRESPSTSIISRLLPEIRDQVEVTVHDPKDRASLCYLAATRQGAPIYFHRRLCEADFVLPISTLRLEQSFAYAGVYAGLFPTFSDEATQQRSRATLRADGDPQQRRRKEESDEAAWLLGIQCMLRVTPGPGDSVLHVLAGSPQAVAREGRARCEAAWLHKALRRASLVLATIEGGPDQQTWENFARALFAASQAVVDGGAIVLCTNLCQPPGPALSHLANGNADDERMKRSLRRERSADADSAALLVEALRRVQVYLMSGLDGDLVEQLGIGHVTCTEEVQRLARQHASFVLLGNAQHAMLATSHG